MENEKFELELLMEQLFAKVIRLFRSCREEDLAYMMRFYNLIRRLIVFKLSSTSDHFEKLCDMVEGFNKVLGSHDARETNDFCIMCEMIENIDKYINSDYQTIAETGKQLNADEYVPSILVKNKKLIKEMFNNLN
jgi:hypothetical protein